MSVAIERTSSHGQATCANGTTTCCVRALNAIIERSEWYVVSNSSKRRIRRLVYDGLTVHCLYVLLVQDEVIQHLNWYGCIASVNTISRLLSMKIVSIPSLYVV